MLRSLVGPFGKRWRVALLLGLASLSRFASADSVGVPAAMQASLITKLVGYDRSFVPRANGKVRVAIIVRAGDNESARVGSEVRETLGAEATIAGLPHEEKVIPWTNASALAEACKSEHFTVVYLSTGLAADAPGIANAIASCPTLTIGANPDYVANGIVVGFDLVFGKPKLLVNLTQAKRQGVDLRAELLKLAKVVS